MPAAGSEREALSLAWGCLWAALDHAFAAARGGLVQGQNAGVLSCARAVLAGCAFMHSAGAPGHCVWMNLLSLVLAVTTVYLLPRRRLQADEGLRAKLGFTLGALLLSAGWGLAPTAASAWLQIGPVTLNLPWLLLPALLRATDVQPQSAARPWAVGGLLISKGQAESSGLLDTIWRDISAIETRVGPPRRRLLMGESMGGLNSLVLGLSQPQHFDKVAALCPAVYLDSPFTPPSQIREGIVRTGADPRIVFGIWQLSRSCVANAEEWSRFSPLALIESASVQQTGWSLYLSAGLYDRYGLYEGTERLAQRAAQRGVPTDWHPLYGGHCAIDVVSLGTFLVR